MIDYNQNDTNDDFKYGITLQVCPLTSFTSPFRLRTTSIGHHVRPTYRVIGSGLRVVYRFITTRCDIIEGQGATFTTKITTQSSRIEDEKEALLYHSLIPDDLSLPDLSKNITQYNKKLSPGVNTWYSFTNNLESSKIKTQLIGCIRDIFKTERGAETYLPDVLKNNIKLLFDYNLPEEEEDGLDKVFESLYTYEISIDKERNKKKGGDKRFLTKICSFITIVTTCCTNSDVTDSLILQKKDGLKIKEIAKQGFLSVIEDFHTLLRVLDGLED